MSSSSLTCRHGITAAYCAHCRTPPRKASRSPDLSILNTQAATTVAALRDAWLNTATGLKRLPRDPPDLSVEDRQLVDCWLRDAKHDSFQKEKMRSARQAELVALEIYDELYPTVEDLSILQVRASHDERWKLADLACGNRMIDVKNSRRSFSSPDSYSEHCVPRFKEDRFGQGVIIAGFLSPYFPAGSEQRNSYGEQRVVWLGETSFESILRLGNTYQTATLTLDFSRQGISMLPPWIFEYPAPYYVGRDQALAMLRAAAEDAAVSSRSIFAAILSGEPSRCHYLAQNGRRDPDLIVESEALCNQLATLEHFGKPALFLHILSRFCQTGSVNESFPASSLRRLIFPRRDDLFGDLVTQGTPWIRCDPLRIIAGLINILEEVSKTCLREAISFEAFRLSGPNILQGRSRGGTWRTIWAYCGGWRNLPNGSWVRCGQNPIYLGPDAPCEACGFLVCHACGYCSRRCISKKEV